MMLRFVIISSLFASHLFASFPNRSIEQSSYYPHINLSFKTGNHRHLARLGVLLPIYGTDNGLLFNQLFGLEDNQSAREANIGLGYRYQFIDWIIRDYGFFDGDTRY